LMAPKKESLRLSHKAAILRETTRVLIRGYVSSMIYFGFPLVLGTARFFSMVTDREPCREGLETDERLPTQLDVATLQRLLPEVDVSRFVGNISDFIESPTKEECLPQPLPCD
uniref:Mitochondrial import receptor subunit TOM22 homolog n=1 Tax=Anisakis simplex TaxID=6269 RepID=A0A0M3JHS1_ANISI